MPVMEEPSSTTTCSAVATTATVNGQPETEAAITVEDGEEEEEDKDGEKVGEVEQNKVSETKDDPVVVGTPTTPSSGGKEKDKEKDMKVDASLQDLSLSVGRLTRSKSRKEEQLLMQLCGGETQETPKPEEKEKAVVETKKGTKGAARTTTPVAQLRQLRARSDGQAQGQAEKEKEKDKEEEKDKKVVRGSQVNVNSTAHANGDVQVVKEKVIVAANRGVASYPRLLRISDGHDQKDGRRNDEASPRTPSGGAGNSSVGSGTGSGSKPQTIIVTETRSLAKVINDAVRKEGSGQSDGKPTLVIIETKSGNTSGPLSSGHHGQSQAHHAHHVPPKSTSVTPTGFTPGASLLANSEASRRATSVTMHPMTRPSISSLYASSTPPAIQMRPSMSSATYSSAAQAMARQASPSPHLISLPPATFPLPEQPRPPFLPKEEEVEDEKGATTDGEKKAKDSSSAKKAAQDNGEISIDVPSLVVPYLIEYPAREKLAEYIRKLKKEEEEANAAEGRSRRTKGGKRRKRKGTGSEDDDYEEDDDEDYEADEDEEEEEDDLDDEDWGGKVAKKVAAAVPSPEPLLSPKPKVGYFDSTLGRFFTDIGLNLVQEWVQVELLRSQKRKLDKGWKSADRERMVKSLTRSLEDYKRKNSPFQFKSKRCPMQACTFKTESRTVLEHHMEALHLHDGRFRCAYCPLDTQEPTEILRHLYERHRVYGRLEKRLLNHTCCLCPFEDASKARLTRHSWKCQKTFDAEKNLAPPPDFEPPAKRVRLVAPVAAITAAAAASTLTAGSSRTGGVAVPAQGYADNRRTGSWSGNSGFPAPPPLRHKGLDAKTLAALGYRSPATQQMLSSASLKGALMSAGIGSMARSQTSSASAAQSQSSAPIIVNSSYQIQQGQLYQVLNAAAGGMVPVVGRPYGQLGNPGFTILPAAHSSVPARGGPTPVALIPNVARSLITSSASGSSGTRTSSCITSRASTSSGLGRPPTSAYSNVRSSSMQALHTKPNISITPVTRSNNVTQSSSVTLTKASSTTLTLSSRTLTGSQSGGQQKSSPASTSNQSPGKFVMCEICDGYIKDLDQLRNHMQWIHKVKIHPKMIHNRPPLNCQKCQSRFFTDQGLERHLLGSHGLVTSSMQDSANKGKDGGRCTVCGRVFVWKLLVHMAKDHKMILKPAHLSYKCTVCSATFTMYRLFENHVYEAHSTVAKKVLDKPEAQKSSTASPASATVPGTSALAASSSSSPSSPQGKHWCTACKVRFNPVPCVHSWKKVCAFRSCRTDRCEKCRALVLGKKPTAGGAGARKQLGGGEDDDDEDEDDDEEEIEDEDSDDKEYVGRVKPTSDGAGRELRSVRSNSKCEPDSGSSASQEGKVSSSALVVATAAVTTVADEVVEVKQERVQKVEVVVEKDGGDDDAPFDMEVEAHEHSEPEEIHTDVEED